MTDSIAVDLPSGVPRPMRWRRPIQIIFYNNPDGYPPIINGVRLLARAGFEVDLYCRDNGEDWNVEYPTSVRVHRLRGAAGNSWREYASFVGRVLRLASPRAGVFIGHDMHSLFPARLLATLYRRPLVYHCHDYCDLNDARAIVTKGVQIVHNFEQRFARTANLVIVPDADRAKVMCRELRLRKKPLIVANAPLKDVTPGTMRLRELLASQGHTFEKIIFRQGRIGDGHAIEATIRSLPLWDKTTWGFVVMGPGEASYAQHLAGVAQTLGVQDRFVQLAPVGYDEVMQFTAGADVGHALYQPIHVNNVHISTASNKIMEYLCASLPLLVSQRPALQKLVDKHECGVSADETNPESIAAAVNQLLGDPHKSQHMGNAARTAFETIFCYDRQFAPVIEAMQKMVIRR
ncbi:hypothetical protein IAD21_00399 [Abditibacteriota bacterium]|nr:hypothetical protein IAD21_00399 [Abditibacteriota bacterium]